MSEHNNQREKLLAELFQDDWSGGPASDYARVAAAHARRRHRLRRALVGTGATAVLAAVLVFGALRQTAHDLAPAALPQTRAGYEIISDDELLAQLRDQPVLVLPQKNGAKTIVLLDR